MANRSEPRSSTIIFLCVILTCTLHVHASMLHEKARSGDDEAFDLEIPHEDLNAREVGTGQTPLMAAALAGKDNVVDKLLRLGADHTIGERDGYTPPHGVAFQGRAKAARALIKHGVPMDVRHADGYTPLHRTIWGGTPRHVQTAEVIVMEGGANVDALDSDGYSPSHRAVDAGWVEMLTALMKLGADPNLKARGTGDALLHAAVKKQNFDMVKLIIDGGGDITAKNSKGLTPKGLAKTLPSAKVRAVLEEAGAKRRREIFGAHEDAPREL